MKEKRKVIIRRARRDARGRTLSINIYRAFTMNCGKYFTRIKRVILKGKNVSKALKSDQLTDP